MLDVIFREYSRNVRHGDVYLVTPWPRKRWLWTN